MRKKQARISWKYVKKTIQGEALSDICDDLGNSFPTADELNNYVTNFYKSLYRIDDTVQGEIEDFLGPEIVNHPMVRGSILTRDERNLLDSEIKIEELDLSLNQSNLKSSPGMDGFSYSFIKNVGTYTGNHCLSVQKFHWKTSHSRKASSLHK